MARRLFEIGSFNPEQGNCWISDLPSELTPGDTAGYAAKSGLLLFEDGNALGPACSAHDLIRKVGRGAFSHWGQALRFSTSDNTPPASNGRRYSVVAEVEEADDLQPKTCGAAPVNYQPLDAASAAIEKDAAYAIATAQSYVDCFPTGLSHLTGRSILELGPGPHFGAALVMLCWGADRVTVADRFLVPFDAGYHIPLYKRLAALLQERGAAVSIDPISEVLRRREHAAAGLTIYSAPLEELSAFGDSRFDITVSNAVFEHLFNPRAAIASLYKLTADCGMGLHQVDFRDHRDFSRPLEFLLEDERSFAVLFEKEFGQTGSRIRPFQMEAMFRDAGFGVVDFRVNLSTEPTYLENFVPRLRASPASPFCTSDIDSLNAISGRFVVKKQQVMGDLEADGSP